MSLEKKQLLDETHRTFIQIGLSNPESLDILDDLVAPDMMGFGTTIDERMFSATDLKELITRQREQSKGNKMSWTTNPAFRKIFQDGNAAVFADDVTIEITIDENTFKIFWRITCVMEYQKDKWKVLHFHSSKPESVSTEEDTYGVDAWKKRNAELEKLVKEKTSELEKSLVELKSTQALLIQSEKMAALGELTAGIAHEIQNPLNFVNNFSELSVDLARELNEEIVNLEIPEKDKEYVQDIIDDLSSNQQKINHHGKRASDIVKGMLQHSRTGSSQKESTDINALCDEYLRLAYHGLRAKDKSFNSALESQFDPNLPMIDVISQDIGRVILNIINNAFYAVSARIKIEEAGSMADGKKYEPKVSVSTAKVGDMIEVKIKDNGTGIPDHVKEKIFQPFFTTKPTGEGTGLGLSLSYDIVKSHGGELQVESKHGEGTEFKIYLPTI